MVEDAIVGMDNQGNPIRSQGEPKGPDLTPPPMPDMVNHPAHYTQCVLPGGRPLECIDVIEALNPGYHLGNVIKYIWRWNHKGERLENLRKARWYLDRAIEYHSNST